MEVLQVEEVHVGGGVEHPQRPVQVQWRRLERDGHALGNDRLHDIAIEHVVLDPLHRRFEPVLAEAGDEVAFVHRRAAQRLGRAWGIGGAPVQAGFQGVDPGLGAIIGLRLSRVGVHDQVQFAAQVVEDHHLIGHHQQDVRGADPVRRAAVFQPLFDVAHGVVAEIADQAAVEAGQLRQVRGVEALLEVFDERQGILGLGLFHHLAVAVQFDPLPEHLEYLPAGQADDRVAPPFLPPLNRFEQVRVGAAGQFQIGAQGRVEIRQDLTVYGDAIEAGLGKLGELLGRHVMDS